MGDSKAPQVVEGDQHDPMLAQVRCVITLTFLRLIGRIWSVGFTAGKRGCEPASSCLKPGAPAHELLFNCSWTACLPARRVSEVDLLVLFNGRCLCRVEGNRSCVVVSTSALSGYFVARYSPRTFNRPTPSSY